MAGKLSKTKVQLSSDSKSTARTAQQVGTHILQRFCSKALVLCGLPSLTSKFCPATLCEGP